eukprot:m.44256 g.44256  ORF g.44256 m.44256 type:complete len:421 (-) comp12309_c0_seq1:523-1785(-)
MAVGVDDVFFFVFCAIGMVVNAWVVLAFLLAWKKLMEFPHNLFIFNLALMDGCFSGAFFVTGLYMIRHDVYVGQTFSICDGAGYLTMFLPCVSICTLAAIAISTAYSLYRPFADHKEKRRRFIMGLIAIYIYATILVASAWIGDGRPRVYTNRLICTADWEIEKHWARATLSNMLGMFLIMVAAYSCTVYIVIKHHRNVTHEQGPNSVLSTQKHDLNVRLGKRLAILVLVYIVVWIPFSVSLLRDLAGRKAADRSKAYDSAAIILLVVGTIINPIVYAFVNDDIRTAYRLAVRLVLQDRPRMILSSLIRRSKRPTLPSVHAAPEADSDHTELPTTGDTTVTAKPLESLAPPSHPNGNDDASRGLSVSESDMRNNSVGGGDIYQLASSRQTSTDGRNNYVYVAATAARESMKDKGKGPNPS